MHAWRAQVTDVAQDTIAIRSLDWDRDRFDIEFGCAPGFRTASVFCMALPAAACPI